MDTIASSTDKELPVFNGNVELNARIHAGKELLKDIVAAYNQSKSGQQLTVEFKPDKYNRIFEPGQLNNIEFELGSLSANSKNHGIDELTNIIKQVIDKEFLEPFESYAPIWVKQKDVALADYTQTRLQHCLGLNSNSTYNNSLAIRAMHLDSGKIHDIYTPIDHFLTESQIEARLSEDPQQYLSIDKDENLTLQNSIIMAAVNMITFKAKSSNNSKLNVKLMYTRAKRGFREKQKFVNWFLGLRDEFYFDSVATTEIHLQKTIYLAKNKIREQLSGGESNFFRSDFRGIPKDYNTHKLTRANKGLRRSEKTLKREQRAPTIDEKDEYLLKGIWNDLVYNDVRLETILMTPLWFKTYTTTIGHSGFYYEAREKKRIRRLSEKGLLGVSEYLNGLFSNLFYHSDIGASTHHIYK